MPTLTLFRQARADGGIRTGIDIDGETLDHFDSGSGEDNPALTWFIDLRFDGENLPTEFGQAHKWMTEHGSVVRDLYREFAKQIEVGLDTDAWPLQWEPPTPLPGVRASVVCSAARRFQARQMHTVVQDLADRWEQYLDLVFQPQAESR